MNDEGQSTAIQVGQVQVLAEAVLTGKNLTEKEFREWLLPQCARINASADTFEWMARTIFPKISGDQA